MYNWKKQLKGLYKRLNIPHLINNKILIIGPTPPPYHGVSIATEMILNSNLQKRFKIIHLDTADRRGLSNMGKIDFANVYLALFHFLKFLWLSIKERPEVVYVPISQATLSYLRDCLFLVPARLFRRKIIIHLHGGYFREFYEQSNRVKKLLIRWTLKDVRRVIILGQSLKYIFEGLVPSERIAVIPNGIEANVYFNYNSRLEEESKILVLFLSTLARPKGFIDVIRCIPEVLKSRNDVKFVFAGELYTKWGEKDEAIEFIKQNKLHSVVKFPGVVTGDEKIKLLLSAAIFVFPSHNEGQPFVILEAMAAGLPIITTDVGAIKEMVADGLNGFMVDKQNPKQIAEKTIFLLENEKLRKEMGQRSRRRFLKYYTKDKFIGNLDKVFEEVLYE